MPAANLFAAPFWSATNEDGTPAIAAELTVFETGTSTPVAVYSDADLDTEIQQPIVTNVAGHSDTPIYVDETPALKLVAVDADGVPLANYPVDPWFPYVIVANLD